MTAAISTPNAPTPPLSSGSGGLEKDFELVDCALPVEDVRVELVVEVDLLSEAPGLELSAAEEDFGVPDTVLRVVEVDAVVLRVDP